MKNLLPIGLFLLAMVPARVSAQIALSGSVKSVQHEPLVGVNVIVKGTSVGTATDVEGMFKLEVPSGASTLVVSLIGFATQEIEIGSQRLPLTEWLSTHRAILRGRGAPWLTGPRRHRSLPSPGPRQHLLLLETTG
jgi:hypothetical protein